jgi:hypothetical protein
MWRKDRLQPVKRIFDVDCPSPQYCAIFDNLDGTPLLDNSAPRSKGNNEAEVESLTAVGANGVCRSLQLVTVP